MPRAYGYKLPQARALGAKAYWVRVTNHVNGKRLRLHRQRGPHQNVSWPEVYAGLLRPSGDSSSNELTQGIKTFLASPEM
jgi:hypothetical protein